MRMVWIAHRFTGGNVYYRGLVEFSNICQNDCGWVVHIWRAYSKFRIGVHLAFKAVTWSNNTNTCVHKCVGTVAFTATRKVYGGELYVCM